MHCSFECGERDRGKERFQMMAWTFYNVDEAIYILLEHLNDGQLTASSGT